MRRNFVDSIQGESDSFVDKDNVVEDGADVAGAEEIAMEVPKDHCTRVDSADHEEQEIVVAKAELEVRD